MRDARGLLGLVLSPLADAVAGGIVTFTVASKLNRPVVLSAWVWWPASVFWAVVPVLPPRCVGHCHLIVTFTVITVASLRSAATYYLPTLHLLRKWRPRYDMRINQLAKYNLLG